MEGVDYLIQLRVQPSSVLLWKKVLLVETRFIVVVVVQLLSHVQLFATSWTAACQASFSISPSVLKLMSINFVMLSNHFTGCCPLLLLSSIFPSIRVFFNESSLCVRQTNYWSFSFSISPSNEYSGLISIRVDWFVLLAVQGTQESSPVLQFESINSFYLFIFTLQHYISINSSVLTFFMVQHLYPYMTQYTR